MYEIGIFNIKKSSKLTKGVGKGYHYFLGIKAPKVNHNSVYFA